MMLKKTQVLRIQNTLSKYLQVLFLFSKLSIVYLLFNIISATNAYSEVWLPWPTRVCVGDQYTQITATGKTRSAVGVKPEYCRCTAGFSPKRHQICAGKIFTATCNNSTWSHYEQIDYGTSRGTSWTPSRSTVFVGTRFTQTSNCGFTRTVTGTRPLPDADRDGIPDSDDQCPGTPAGQTVNGSGCSKAQLDADLDGVRDANDQCADTSKGATVNTNGCALYQLDTDVDGVNDEIDQCANTDVGKLANSLGCALYQLDSDADGVNDEVDHCPDTQIGASVTKQGCDLDLDDYDGDGTVNDQDAYPFQSATQCLF